MKGQMMEFSYGGSIKLSVKAQLHWLLQRL